MPNDLLAEPTRQNQPRDLLADEPEPRDLLAEQPEPRDLLSDMPAPAPAIAAPSPVASPVALPNRETMATVESRKSNPYRQGYDQFGTPVAPKLAEAMDATDRKFEGQAAGAKAAKENADAAKIKAQDKTLESILPGGPFSNADGSPYKPPTFEAKRSQYNPSEEERKKLDTEEEATAKMPDRFVSEQVRGDREKARSDNTRNVYLKNIRAASPELLQGDGKARTDDEAFDAYKQLDDENPSRQKVGRLAQQELYGSYDLGREPKSRGVIGEVGTSLARGVVSATQDARFAVGQVVAPSGGSEIIARDQIKEKKDALAPLRMSTDMGAGGKVLYSAVESAPQLAAQMLAAYVTGGSSLAFAATAAGPVMTSSFASTYKLVLDNGGTADDALKTSLPKALADGAITAITSKIEYKWMMANPSLHLSFMNLAKETAKGMVSEGIQEGTEQTFQQLTDAMARYANDIKQLPLKEQLEAIGMAAAAGGLAGGALKGSTFMGSSAFRGDPGAGQAAPPTQAAPTTQAAQPVPPSPPVDNPLPVEPPPVDNQPTPESYAQEVAARVQSRQQPPAPQQQQRPTQDLGSSRLNIPQNQSGFTDGEISQREGGYDAMQAQEAQSRAPQGQRSPQDVQRAMDASRSPDNQQLMEGVESKPRDLLSEEPRDLLADEPPIAKPTPDGYLNDVAERVRARQQTPPATVEPLSEAPVVSQTAPDGSGEVGFFRGNDLNALREMTPGEVAAKAREFFTTKVTDGRQSEGPDIESGVDAEREFVDAILQQVHGKTQDQLRLEEKEKNRNPKFISEAFDKALVAQDADNDDYFEQTGIESSYPEATVSSQFLERQGVTPWMAARAGLIKQAEQGSDGWLLVKPAKGATKTKLVEAGFGGETDVPASSPVVSPVADQSGGPSDSPPSQEEVDRVQNRIRFLKDKLAEKSFPQKVAKGIESEIESLESQLESMFGKNKSPLDEAFDLRQKADDALAKAKAYKGNDIGKEAELIDAAEKAAGVAAAAKAKMVDVVVGRPSKPAVSDSEPTTTSPEQPSGNLSASPEVDGGKDFYVTMIRDGNAKKPAWLAGPFKTKAEAEARVEDARKAASKADPKSNFDAFGTASVPSGTGPKGVLNKRLGITEPQGQSKRKQTHMSGDLGEYNGKTQQIAGSTFYEVEMLEGTKKGKVLVTSRGPDGSDPFVDRNKKEYEETQAGFRRLNKLQGQIAPTEPPVVAEKQVEKAAWDNATLEDESRWYGTEVEVASDGTGEAFTGTVTRVLNRGKLVEVRPEGQDQGSFRVNADRVTVTKLVDYKMAESERRVPVRKQHIDELEIAKLAQRERHFEVKDMIQREVKDMRRRDSIGEKELTRRQREAAKADQYVAKLEYAIAQIDAADAAYAAEKTAKDKTNEPTTAEEPAQGVVDESDPSEQGEADEPSSERAEKSEQEGVTPEADKPKKVFALNTADGVPVKDVDLSDKANAMMVVNAYVEHVSGSMSWKNLDDASEAAVDAAYRAAAVEVPSSIEGVKLFALPGKEAALKAGDAKAAKVKEDFKPPVFLAKPKKASDTTSVPRKAENAAEKIKAVSVAALKEGKSRYGLNNVLVADEGGTIVTTDGARMFIGKGSKGEFGNDGVFALDKGTKAKETAKDDDGDDVKFPPYKDVIPRETGSYKKIEIDAETVLRRLRQAALATNEESSAVAVYLNPDGSLGFAARAPELVTAEIGIEDGAKFIIGMKPKYIIEAVKFHVQMGGGPITATYHGDTKPLVMSDPSGSQSVTMPVLIDGPTNVAFVRTPDNAPQSLADQMDSIADRAGARVTKRNKGKIRSLAGVDPRDIADLAIYAALKIGAKGIRIVGKSLKLKQFAYDTIRASHKELKLGPQMDLNQVARKVKYLLSESVSGDEFLFNDFMVAAKKVTEDSGAELNDDGTTAEDAEAATEAAKPPVREPTARVATKVESDDDSDGPTIIRGKDELSPPGMTSSRKVDLAQVRAFYKMSEFANPEARTFAELRERALREYTPESTDAMVAEIAAGRIANDLEIAAMDVRLVELRLEHKENARQIDKTTNPASIQFLKNNEARIELLIDDLTSINRTTGREAARTLNARKMTINDELDLVTVLQRAKNKRGSALTEVERAKYKQEIRVLEERLAKLEAAEQAIQDSNVASEITKVKKQSRRAKPKESIESLVEQAKALIAGGCH